jgi:hypothetical protein
MLHYDFLRAAYSRESCESLLGEEFGKGLIECQAAKKPIENLLKLGVPPGVLNEYAVASGNLQLVEHLLLLGFDVMDDGESICVAAEHGHLGIVKFLVALGSDPREDEDHPAQWAAANGHLETLKFLVALGASPFGRDDFAMRNAVECGNLEVLEYLLELGLPIARVSDYAGEQNQEEVLEWLSEL